MSQDRSTTASHLPQQVGGNHYSLAAARCPHCNGEIQHWDLAADQPYLAAQVSKYTTRFAHKNGLEDLYKARTYLDKLILLEESKVRRTARSEHLKHVYTNSVMTKSADTATPTERPQPAPEGLRPNGSVEAAIVPLQVMYVVGGSVSSDWIRNDDGWLCTSEAFLQANPTLRGVKVRDTGGTILLPRVALQYPPTEDTSMEAARTRATAYATTQPQGPTPYKMQHPEESPAVIRGLNLTTTGVSKESTD